MVQSVPLYEYQCDSCGHRFELIRKFSDPPASSCPRCGGPITKLVSSPAFHLKGSGWYATDYAKKSEGAKGGSAESKEASAKDTKDSKDSKESKDVKGTKDTASKESSPKETAPAPASAPAPSTKTT